MAYLGRSVDQSFFFGATPEIKERAKALRKRMTCCEKILWQVLRKNKVRGCYFRRQHPISKFIVDFYCHELRLAVEIDGSYHALEQQQEHDSNRSAELENLGIKVIRFTNQAVIENIRKVERQMDEEVRKSGRAGSPGRSPPPQPSPRGEGVR